MSRRPVFDSRQRQEIFLCSIAYRLALMPTQLPIQWVKGALSLDVKRPEREADHSSPSIAEVKNGGTLEIQTKAILTK
jgi:hypothetical protein